MIRLLGALAAWACLVAGTSFSSAADEKPAVDPAKVKDLKGKFAKGNFDPAQLRGLLEQFGGQIDPETLKKIQEKLKNIDIEKLKDRVKNFDPKKLDAIKQKLKDKGVEFDSAKIKDLLDKLKKQE